jgi:hypothetical protein
MPDFIGLGQLRPDQLASLLDTRHPITGGEIDLGTRPCEDDKALARCGGAANHRNQIRAGTR